jgi:hypothetical protein
MQKYLMTMKTPLILFTLMGMALLAVPAFAHHSFAAEYDSSKPVKFTGAVTKIDWANPHVYFYIDVKDADSGKVTNWAFEMGAPAVLTRSGWKRSSLKIGDVITVEGTMARDGSKHGNARNVVMTATGEKLGAGSSENTTETGAAR